MTKINKPMDIPELNLHPPITGKVNLSDDMQQTLSLLCAAGDGKRVLLRVSESGVLFTGEPAIKEIVHVTGSGSPSVAQGGDIACSSVMIIGHPDNTDTAWVRPYAAVASGYGWPLQKWDMVRFVVPNLNRLHFLFDTSAEKVIIAYTR